MAGGGRGRRDHSGRYADRRAAGDRLARLLAGRFEAPVVLALPRGGVPVAAPVAAALHAPLGVVVVGKVGAPDHRELAMGAVALTGGTTETFRHRDIVASLGVSDTVVAEAERVELALARRREVDLAVRDPEVAGRVVILVDDGLATGSTMMAAARAVRTRGPSRLVVAVPVAADSAVDLLATVADEVVCPEVSSRFPAVGAFYDDFSQTSDDEVRTLLRSWTISAP